MSLQTQEEDMHNSCKTSGTFGKHLRTTFALVLICSNFFFCPDFRPESFLELDHWFFFFIFGMVFETHTKLCVTTKLLGKIVFAQK